MDLHYCHDKNRSTLGDLFLDSHSLSFEQYIAEHGIPLGQFLSIYKRPKHNKVAALFAYPVLFLARRL